MECQVQNNVINQLNFANHSYVTKEAVVQIPRFKHSTFENWEYTQSDRYQVYILLT